MRVLAVNASRRMNGSLLGGLELWRALATQGWQVDVLMEDGAGARAVRHEGFFVRSARVPTWWCGFKCGEAGPRPGNLVRFLRWYRPSVRIALDQLRRERYDLIYANTSASVVGVFAAAGAGVPVVCHIRERIDEGRTLGRLHARFLARHCQGIIANSGCSAEPFRGLREVEVIHDGVAEHLGHGCAERSAIRSSWEVAPEDPVVLVLGSYSIAKGHGVLLRLAPRILARAPRTKFVFCGNLPSRRPGWRHAPREAWTWRAGEHEPARLVRRLNLEAAVRFTGWTDDVDGALAGADVVAFPSIIHEGFGRPIAEAGVCRKPVVAFAIGAAPEIIDEGRTGLLAAPGDTDGFADRLIEVLTDPDRGARMGDAAADRIRTRFALGRHTTLVSDYLGQVARESASRGRRLGLRHLLGASGAARP